MLFGDKTQNNIMLDLIAGVDSDISTEEGTLVNHAFRGAAAEFEQAYIGLGIINQNGYAATADREHLILRARERGIIPFSASNAVWKAEFNIDVPINSRFSSKELTYLCTEQIESRTYRLICEQTGTIGNTKKGELLPIDFIEGLEEGVLTELLIPARDEETTEDFRARYLSVVTETQAFGGNRAQYKQAMHEIPGVGACKIYRVTETDKRIKIYFLNSLYQEPGAALVAEVQEMIDPPGKQGEGEGIAAIFHVVDIYPCSSENVNIEADVSMEPGYQWEDVLPEAEKKIDEYFLELAKEWENENCLTVRILRINAAIASVKGVIDVQGTALNGEEKNVMLDPNSVPVRGVLCRK